MSPQTIFTPAEIIVYQERLKTLLTHENLLDEIVAYITNGGDLVTLAEIWTLRVSDIFKWLNSDRVRRQKYDQALIDRDEWAVEKVMSEIKRLAYSDLSLAFNDDGSLKSPKEWPNEIKRVIASVEVDELFEGVGKDREQIGVTKKIKLWPKTEALKMVAQQLGLLVDRHKLEIGMKLEDIIAAANETVPHVVEMAPIPMLADEVHRAAEAGVEPAKESA